MEQDLLHDLKLKKVDTDSEENRIKRGENQYQFQKEGIEQTYGKPLKERYFIIRNNIFKSFDNVKGESVKDYSEKNSIVSSLREQNEIRDEFVPLKEAADKVMPLFEENINRWYETINAMPSSEDKDKVTERFLSVLFVGGIHIHPAVDGNGQTFKLLVESYAKEMHSQVKDKFLPVKYTQDEWTAEKDMSIPFVGGGRTPEYRDISSVAVTPFKPADDEEKIILDGLDLARKVKTRVSSSKYKDDEALYNQMKKTGETIRAIMRSVASETKNLQFANFLEDERISRLDGGGALVYLQRASEDRLREKGLHDTWEYHATVYSPPGEKVDRVSAAIKQLWGSEEGTSFAEKYIFEGVGMIDERETPKQELFWKATNALNDQREKIVKTFETEEEHERAHQEAMEKYKD